MNPWENKPLGAIGCATISKYVVVYHALATRAGNSLRGNFLEKILGDFQTIFEKVSNSEKIFAEIVFLHRFGQ